MTEKPKKLEKLFSWLLIFSGAFLISHVFVFKKHSIFLQAPSFIDAIFGIWWSYFVGWALIITLCILFIVFIFAMTLYVILSNKLNLDVKFKVGRFLNTNLIGQKTSSRLFPWLLKALRQFILVLYGICLAVMLMLIYAPTSAFSTQYYREYMLFIAAGYLIMLGMHRLKILQRIENRIGLDIPAG